MIMILKINLPGKWTLASLLLGFHLNVSVNAQHSQLVNEPVDISEDFRDFSNTVFFCGQPGRI